MQNNKLSDFSAWQWELAIVASRFELGLFSDDEIIAFTHKLMDKGYYDDVMLDIIDDDPLYPTGSIYEGFTKLFTSLNFPIFTLPEAKYFNTFNRIYSFAQRPFNINQFYQEPLLKDFYGYFYDLLGFDNQNRYTNIEDFRDVIYRLDYALELFVDNMYTKKATNEAIFDFLIECENWIIRNQTQIENVLKKINTREENDDL